MRLSFKTTLVMACLLLGAATLPAYAQKGGVPALGFYRPCIQNPMFEKAVIIQPQFEVAQIVRPEIERAVIVPAQFERPLILRPDFEKPDMIRPEFINPCIDGTSALFSIALMKSSTALGMKFDAEGRVVTRKEGLDATTAALLPANLAVAGAAARPGAVTPLNTACCGDAPAKAAPSNIRVRARTTDK